MQTEATELAPSARGSAVALFACGFFIGQGLGPLVFGALLHGARRRGRRCVAVAAVIVVLGRVVVARRSIDRRRRRRWSDVPRRRGGGAAIIAAPASLPCLPPVPPPPIAPLRITAYTATTAAGAGKAALLAALRDGRSGLHAERLRADAAADLDRPRRRPRRRRRCRSRCADWDCRNNRLAWLGLHGDGFIDAVARGARALRRGPRRARARHLDLEHRRDRGRLPRARRRRPLSRRASAARACTRRIRSASFVQEALGLEGPVRHRLDRLLVERQGVRARPSG